MLATGAYLRTLREAQDLSQGKLAELIGVTANTIWRIESGRQEPKTAQIINLLAVLKGRAEDLARLINDADATADDGLVAAQERLQELIAQTSPEVRSRVADQLRQMAAQLEAPGVAQPPDMSGRSSSV